jgi:hypothetical protein
MAHPASAVAAPRLKTNEEAKRMQGSSELRERSLCGGQHATPDRVELEQAPFAAGSNRR